VTSSFHRVLVGFDGSEPARDALVLAQRLADPDGELLLAYVDVHRAFRLAHGRHRPPAEDLLAAARAEVDGTVRIETVECEASSAARGLTELAEQTRVDVVVIGAHHGSAERRTTPGATALRLLQGAPCAVAIAPLGMREHEPFHHVGVAYDGSPEADVAVAAAYALAARDGTAVSLFLVLPPSGLTATSETSAQVEAALQSRRNRAHQKLDTAADSAPDGVNPRTVLLYGDAPEQITRAGEGIVDVLFCGSRGYGPLQRALAGSVSEQLLLSATQPVVVLPRGGAQRSEAPAEAS
jgi:nucleotide-binding universal stress UspA family protein